MHPAETKILHQLTGKYSLEEIAVEELQQIANKYPYFGLAQFLLAKKLYQLRDANFEKQAQRAALHFPNILWMHYQLHKDEWTENTEAVHPPENNFSPEEQEILPHQNETNNVEQAGTKAAQEITLDEEAQQSLINTETLQPENNSEIISSNASSQNLAQNESPEINSAAADEYINQTEQAIIIESNEKIANVLDAQIAEFKKPVEENAEVKIQSEPYHTVDYFASQGIKFNASENSPDKLETKVRRFTDWLKQMKRINPQPTDLGTDEASEHLIQNIAESSNQAKEVITEAMAEVLARQGKTDKAIQVYIKLSFLEPSKSAYFAAKIQQLKGI